MLLLFLVTVALYKSFVVSIGSNTNLDSDSQWAPFCDEKLYYKPYVRVRQGRNGPVIKDMGPGIFETSEKENLYVCTNGLVFLYFKIRKHKNSEIFDDAVMQYTSHYCSFFNGKPGPGMASRESTLVSVVLLGHPEDYRQVALQMFTAPLFNPATNVSSMFTSLVIINTDGECILEKGEEKAKIRIKGNPSEEIQQKTYQKSEEHHTTICRLDGHLLMQDDNSKIPLDTEWVTKDEVVQALSSSLNSAFPTDLKLQGCYKYPLLDQKQIDIIIKRKTTATSKGFDLSSEKSELNPEDGEGIRFWTADRIKKYGNPATAAPADNATLEADIKSKNETLLQLSKTEKPDVAAIEVALKELNGVLFKAKLAPYLTHYQKIFESAKTASQSATSAWEAVATVVQDATLNQVLKNYTQVQQDLSMLEHQKILEPYNPIILSAIEEARIAIASYKSALLTKTLELGPKITKAEIMSSRRNVYVTEATIAMRRLNQFILAFENAKGKPLSSELEFKEPKQLYKDTFVSVKKPSGGGMDETNPICLTFQRKEDQCKFMKPTPTRACQLGKAKLVGAGNWKGGDADKWRDDVLESLHKIFAKGCTQLEEGFAKEINGILKAYLNKQLEEEKDAGTVIGSPFLNNTRQNFMSKYNISKKEDLYPSLPAKDAVPWDNILDNLKNCEKNVKPLEFSVETSSGSSSRILFKGSPVPEYLEQAEMEFSFNWAVDNNFRIFATVIGLCRKEFNESLVKDFYRGYTSSFLDPIRPIWLSNKDNSILSLVMGQHYATGKGDLWTRQCLEASYLEGEKKNVRPIRNLFVNSYTEFNYVVMGPGQGTRGPFYENPSSSVKL